MAKGMYHNAEQQEEAEFEEKYKNHRCRSCKAKGSARVGGFVNGVGTIYSCAHCTVAFFDPDSFLLKPQRKRKRSRQAAGSIRPHL